MDNSNTLANTTQELPKRRKLRLAPKLEKLRVYVFQYKNGADWYEMTETELADKCCIFDGRLYFKDTVIGKKDKFGDKLRIKKENATIEDIWNCEAFAWDEMPKTSYTYKTINKSYEQYLSSRT